MEDNKREGADNIRMVLNLSEAAFDIIAMEDNVIVRIGDAEVPNTTVDTGENVSITSLQLRSIRSAGASHVIVIHRDCLWSWAQLCIEDLTWRFRRMEMNMLRSEETMRDVFMAMTRPFLAITA